jgi:hypothetical protein
MDLQQTWAQVQALSLGDQQTILENLLNTLTPSNWAGTEDELLAEIVRREEEDIANPKGGCTLEEFWAERAAKK